MLCHGNNRIPGLYAGAEKAWEVISQVTKNVGLQRIQVQKSVKRGVNKVRKNVESQRIQVPKSVSYGANQVTKNVKLPLNSRQKM